MTIFNEAVRKDQIAWRKANLTNQTQGQQNKRHYDHILPKNDWEQNLFPGIRSDGQSPLPSYLAKHRVQAHTGVHNLCSSWILCANMYFPFRSASGRGLLVAFLKTHVSPDITAVDDVELEYEVDDPRFTPAALLGEDAGSRGSGQTSPDVAFIVRTAHGKGLILTESKFTEHSFYRCSGCKKKDRGRPENPHPDRCRNFGLITRSPKDSCHLVQWGRRYWDHLEPVPGADSVTEACPASTGAYQLFRQQALANALQASGNWDLVVSAVAYDKTNEFIFKVIGSGKRKTDVRQVWSSIFTPTTAFVTFTHQSWVAWVREHGGAEWRDWLAYVAERYKY
jgi:hypothetical protein